MEFKASIARIESFVLLLGLDSPGNHKQHLESEQEAILWAADRGFALDDDGDDLYMSHDENTIAHTRLALVW